MKDSHEIIITTRDDPNSPRVVQFSELYVLRESILTMMHLWNHNSYYVDAESRTFIINGGRKMGLDQLGECRILYRRRNQFKMGMNAEQDNGGPKDKTCNWIMGVEDMRTGKMVLLQISKEGHKWMWTDKL